MKFLSCCFCRTLHMIILLYLIIIQRRRRPELLNHRENTRREESKYLECENRQLGLSAIATYIFKPPTEKFKIGR